MKALLVISLFLVSVSATAQRVIKLERYAAKDGQLLSLTFPVDAIVYVKILNNSGAHVLSAKELKSLKNQLGQAKFAGGLLIKPGHIVLEIRLAKNTSARPGFVYGSTGAIHFENGIDKFGKRFNGTFNLPTRLNFDNYK